MSVDDWNDCEHWIAHSLCIGGRSREWPSAATSTFYWFGAHPFISENARFHVLAWRGKYQYVDHLVCERVGCAYRARYYSYRSTRKACIVWYYLLHLLSPWILLSIGELFSCWIFYLDVYVAIHGGTARPLLRLDLMAYIVQGQKPCAKLPRGVIPVHQLSLAKFWSLFNHLLERIPNFLP